MGSRICNQKNRECAGTKQDYKASGGKGDIGDRANNLVRLIGADRVSRQNYKYEGTYYVTEDGELYDKEHVIAQKGQRTGVSFSSSK